MRTQNFDIQDVIDYLQGTCGNNIDFALGKDGILNEDFTPKYPDMTINDLTVDDYNAIDNQIFLCENCGWWCGTDEANEHPQGLGDICDDCLSEISEDE